MSIGGIVPVTVDDGGGFAFSFDSDSDVASAPPSEVSLQEAKPRKQRAEPPRKATAWELPPAPVDDEIETLLDLAVHFNSGKCDPDWESSEARRERLALAKQIHQVAKTDRAHAAKGSSQPGVFGLVSRRPVVVEGDDGDVVDEYGL